MSISAKVVADSKNEFGNRITTMVVTFPRIILAEFNTHRMFSRNSASSRAIPFEKMVKSVVENPFIPIAWQKDHKGMQGIEYLNEEESKLAIYRWNCAKEAAVHEAKILSGNMFSINDTSYNINITKQLCNRLLEPFMWHTVIVTSTEWENFFALRCPQYQIEEIKGIFRSKKDYVKASKEQLNLIEKVEDYTDLQWLQINKGQAEIHMMALAEVMWDAYNESTPKELKVGEWHIPFGDNINIEQVNSIWRNNKGLVSSLETSHYPALQEGISKEEYEEFAIKIATARCARVSYTVVGEEGKEANYENDIKLHDRLVESGHWSPFEHCATPMHTVERENNGEWSGNFRGFIQYRKLIPNENITK